MTSISAQVQRARRPPAHPSTQAPGSMHNIRETSRSPSLRSRTLKAHSMPIVPSAMQIFSTSNPPQQPSQAQQQPSPTLPNSRRSPPNGVQVQRLLPTPPHPPREPSPERHMSPPPPPQHSHNPPNPHYPRPINRAAPPQFLTKYQNMDQESWQMTEELLAEIERADLQQSQAQTNPGHPYPTGKDPNVERVRAADRSSPKELDSNQQQRRQQAPRESPKGRQPTSPNAPFTQPQALTPERRGSPLYQTSHAPPGDNSPTAYIQYTRESPPVIRRTSNVTNPPSSLATQTPPLQAINARTPDRSLPVQEEPEDEPGATKNGTGTREMWQGTDDQSQHVRHAGSSPTPPSDLHPDGGYIDNRPHVGRSNGPDHRDDGGPTIEHVEAGQHRYSERDRDRDHAEEEGGYTPRSPTADLPEHPPTQFYQSQAPNPRVAQPLRNKARNGSTDQLGLRTFDPSVFENDQGILPMGSEQPPQYAEQRRPTQNHSQNQKYNDPRTYSNQHQYRESQMHPDDIQQYDSSAYIQAYLQSPRPDAPIPPTPHSQTAAPSPSPLLSSTYDGGGKALPPFSPVVPVGSPYPYPFSHMRRNQSFSGHPNRPQPPPTYDPNDPVAIQEQLVKQWQIYAQNNHGNMTDSTFSPSSTPFQGGNYNPWAYLHTNRTLGRVHDTTSLRSSPSHEPVALPTPPPMIGVKKSRRQSTVHRSLSNRKPPPRVESTQPRETSPEPSSSGEETAGEERFAVPEEGNWVNGAISVPAPVDDDGGAWIDEEDDEEDLLELEYHPGFVSNVEKRRRRWEIGWEALTQAFQALDRQTDATMILLAAPSHSTKLYSASSRSLRRQPTGASATTMKELRAGFSRIATHRRTSRSHKSSLLDRFLLPSNSSTDGSDGSSSESREEDLKRALEAALGSLGALGGIYEQREARWHDEMRRIVEDRERVELLLRQVLGDAHNSSAGRAS